MIERIKAHLDNLFDGVPRTRKIEDMYQELLAGCLDKYTDLTSGGMDSEEAYYKVIGGIGDVDELLGYVEKTETFNYSDVAEKRRKRAFFTSASICGYFIALSMLFLFMYNGSVEIGLALMVAFAGVSTMALIYGRMTNAVRYEKADDTLVEEMKEQMTTGKNKNKLASLASSSLWSIVVTIYLVVSFVSGRWMYTWMIFPFAAGLQNLVSAYFLRTSKTKFYIGAFWCFVVTLYCIISFWTFAWAVTWIIFPCAVAVQQALRMFFVWREIK